MLMSHTSVDYFVLSFVFPCSYAFVAIVKIRLYASGDIKTRIACELIRGEKKTISQSKERKARVA